MDDRCNAPLAMSRMLSARVRSVPRREISMKSGASSRDKATVSAESSACRRDASAAFTESSACACREAVPITANSSTTLVICRPPPPYYLAAASPAADFKPLRSDVLRLWTYQMIFGVLLDDVRTPARDASACERRHERPRLEADALQHECRVELDVGAQIAAGLHFLEHPEDRLLDGPREVEQLAVLDRAVRRAHLVGHLAQHVGARIADLVDAMAEAHDPPPARQLVAHPRLGPLGRPDVLQHVEHRNGRAAMQRPLLRADRPGHGAHHVRARARDDARSECRRVHPVVDDG